MAEDNYAPHGDLTARVQSIQDLIFGFEAARIGRERLGVCTECDAEEHL